MSNSTFERLRNINADKSPDLVNGFVGYFETDGGTPSINIDEAVDRFTKNAPALVDSWFNDLDYEKDIVDGRWEVYIYAVGIGENGRRKIPSHITKYARDYNYMLSHLGDLARDGYAEYKKFYGTHASSEVFRNNNFDFENAFKYKLPT